MSEKYALRITVESHDYVGDFYLVGEGYATGGDVLEHVAADHVLRAHQAWTIEEYLLDVLQKGQTVSEAEYDAWDADVSCGLHVDVSHQRYSFWAGDREVQIEGDPTEDQIASLADDLRSQ